MSTKTLIAKTSEISDGNSMTRYERPSLEPLLKPKASPAVLSGTNAGNALEASKCLDLQGFGGSQPPGKALRAFPG